MLRRAHMNEKSAMFSPPASFALSLSKGKRGVFQHPVRLCQWGHRCCLGVQNRKGDFLNSSGDTRTGRENNCSQSSAYEVLNGDGRKRIAVANYVLTLEENPLSGLTPDLISFSFILASLCSRARFTRDSMWSASKGFAM